MLGVHRLPWPLPAILVWGLSWLLFAGLASMGVAPSLALAWVGALGVAASVLGTTWWRRVMIALGFPLSLAASGAAALPAWAWLLPLLLLLLIYPLNAWRDAPLFPTPKKALKHLAAQVPLVQGALILDAGCGLGDGLLALRAAYPQARLHGLEWSWPLRALCALRCPWARVRQGDIWRADWSAYDMVYLFQRPESMPRAVAKARAELKSGAYLVSLEFAAQELRPLVILRPTQGKPVWVYRIPLEKKKSS
ncbi:MAG: class I SAM-dependent methyltransferase [Rhodoferax sp.]|nr:class I SAM-dependent methyltransferase [Rhodoferax sp.]OIP20036.1 MAG: methyltransferase type 12 [Comamonadaceae bacterium CG2_30_60_41]PIW10433.1 MAG: methyltransferase type 12 [Comamonadaceae bacterium CG17_big_fil_post_rev_8_21_14_2_50_60_13]PIY25748.1 MAG: methyltransferase type 12 [Comamonadaceae bacterium CG_4_10_14_3_um_filter_60_75]PJC14381.1 MAG: methyltransferase type 12 [Comamonadaceae bacterium CG_4_9_14_0_8_um_filter_60_18]